MEPLMVFASGLALFAVLKAAERILEWFSARRHRKRVERRLLLLSLHRAAEDMRAGRYSQTYPNIPKP